MIGPAKTCSLLLSEVREKPVYVFLAECLAGSDGAVLLHRRRSLGSACLGKIPKTGQEGIEIRLGKTGARRSRRSLFSRSRLPRSPAFRGKSQ